MTLELHTPQDGFYKGTRFDRGGVFKSLVFGGVEMCGQWFENYSPTMHDAVLGPAEEFSPMPVTPGPSPVIPGPDRGSHTLKRRPFGRLFFYNLMSARPALPSMQTVRGWSN